MVNGTTVRVFVVRPAGRPSVWPPGPSARLVVRPFVRPRVRPSVRAPARPRALPSARRRIETFCSLNLELLIFGH